MKHLFLSMLGIGAVACSSLPASGDGVVALEVQSPPNITLAATDSVTLHARALDIDGNPVAADIRWYTVDTLVISVDAVTGTVHPVATKGSGRVQAVVGTLLSDIVNISIQVSNP